MHYLAHRHREPETRLADYLVEARTILAAPPDQGGLRPAPLSPDFEALRWFWLPDEVAAS